MRSPAPALLALVAPVLACFADAGGRTSAGGVTANMTSSSDASSTGGETTDSAATSSTGAPTPTTGEPTTDDTTTAAMPTTGAPDNCEVAPQCVAGEVEDGALCDPCGVQRRTCQPDCTWTPMACEQAPETCEYWVLPTAGKQWERVAADPMAKFAPEGPVLAAVALPPQAQIYVMTADTYHVFSTQSRAWIGAGARETIFPELAGLSLYHATGLTTDAPDTIVTLVAGKEAFSYTFVGAVKGFVFGQKTPCCGVNWEGPNAPDPYAVRDGWTRLGDPEGWIDGDVQTLCNLDMPTPVFGYNLSIGEGTVYPQDIGHCFDFFAPVAYEKFAPFAAPGAPPNALVGGVEWLDGLWVFRGDE